MFLFRVITLDDFADLKSRLERAIPRKFRAGLSGILVYENRKENPDLPGIFTMGEYVIDPQGMGRYVVLYFGSFQAVLGRAPYRVWRREVWKTLTHEIQHHLELSSGVDHLGDEDKVQMHGFRKALGKLEEPPPDPIYRTAINVVIAVAIGFVLGWLAYRF